MNTTTYWLPFVERGNLITSIPTWLNDPETGIGVSGGYTDCPLP